SPATRCAWRRSSSATGCSHWSWSRCCPSRCRRWWMHCATWRRCAACNRSVVPGTWWRAWWCPPSATWTSSPTASARCPAWSAPRPRWCCPPSSSADAAYNARPPAERDLAFPAVLRESDFHYHLPAELIAQAPLPERSASRLLLVPPAPAPFADHVVRDLPALLEPGDLLVFNDTRVIPARLHGQKDSGGRVEILIERMLPGNEARAQVGASKPPRPGGRIALDGGGEVEVLGREGGFYRLRFHVHGALADWLQHAGSLPLPPYIRRAPEAADQARYQT